MAQEEDKSPIKNAKKFTAEYQPTGAAKAKGRKKAWVYRKARQRFFEELCEIDMPDGTKRNFWDEVREKLQNMLTNDHSPLTSKERADLMIKLCKEFMPEDKQVKIDSDGPVTIVFGKEDKDL